MPPTARRCPTALQTHPMMAVMNAMGYDAMTLGNHEFNFGSDVFKSVLKQADFPILQRERRRRPAQYGLAAGRAGGEGVKPYVEIDARTASRSRILGITNHRVPNYELPSNIPGPDLQRPASRRPRQLRDRAARQRRCGHGPDPHRLHREPEERRSRQERRHQHGGAGQPAWTRSSAATATPTPSRPRLGRLQVPADHRGRAGQHAGDHQPGLPLQQHPGRGRPRRPRQGWRRLRGGHPRRAVPHRRPWRHAEDPAIKAIVDPYVAQLTAYNNTVVGQTTVPIDTLKAFTQETNGANLQADASVCELAKQRHHDVDFHLSGAMTNKLIADQRHAANPVTLKVSDMFTAMPYENSLVVLQHERAAAQGGAGARLPQLLLLQVRARLRRLLLLHHLHDRHQQGRQDHLQRHSTRRCPTGNNVVSLTINGEPVDFTDATKYYRVSTVNYLAAGSCNFNDGGVSLWPLDQIVNDTQYYVRDAVIDYITHEGIVSPAIEGRLVFN